jgi:glycosyltransferase involved in cell wall biosynthesis
MAHVCIVSWYAYPLFEPSVSTIFGGSEVRAWLLGTGLARAGAHRVSFVVFDHGQGVRDFAGIRVHPHAGYAWQPQAPKPASRYVRLRNAALRLLRSQPTTPPARLKVLDYEIPADRTATYREVGADIYCAFGVGTGTAEVLAFCRSEGKRFVLFIGTDEDLSPLYRAGSRELSAYGSRVDVCHYVLMHADLIVVQTARQEAMLKNSFGRTGTVLPNPVGRPAARPDAPARDLKPFFLWVGKSDSVKRPDLVLEAARRSPQHRFVVIMNRSDGALHDRLCASAPANVRILESVPFASINAYYAHAVALLNTSRFEGFPNAFLEAGRFGTPVISLQVDPDGILRAYDAGILADGDFERFVAGLDELAVQPERRADLGRNLRCYVEAHHAQEVVVDRLSGMLQQALQEAA